MAMRLVDKNGKFSWEQQKEFVTGSLAGWEVDLQRAEKANWKSGSVGLLLEHNGVAWASSLCREFAAHAL
jgi:hypothetical protein